MVKYCMMMENPTVWVLTIACVCLTVMSQRTSICPDILKYKNSTEENFWYADIILQTKDELNGVWMEIQLDAKAQLLGNMFANVTSKNNMNFFLMNSNYILSPGDTLTIPIFVRFKNVSPAVESIRLNGVQICPPNEVQLDDIFTVTPGTVTVTYETPKTLATPVTREVPKMPTSTTRPTTTVTADTFDRPPSAILSLDNTIHHLINQNAPPKIKSIQTYIFLSGNLTINKKEEY